MPVQLREVHSLFLDLAVLVVALGLCSCTAEESGSNAPGGAGGGMTVIGPDGQPVYVPPGGGGISAGMGGAPGAAGAVVGNAGSVAGAGVPGAAGAIATAGSGGVASGGAGSGDECVPVTGRCVDCKTAASGINATIDAFEDGDKEINKIDGRDGEWFQTSALSSGMPLGTLAWEPTTTAAPGSSTALHITGGATGAMTDWATFGVTIGLCYDASLYTGISFWIKGNAAAGNDTIRFSIATPPTTEVSSGGECPDGDEGCYAHFGADIILTPDWQKVELSWAQLLQPASWGIKAPPGYVKEQNILAINFAPFLNTLGYDFWIDDVEFMSGTPGNCGDLISAEQFNAFFPNRNALYSYESFVAAAKRWPSFCNEGDEAARLRDVAALFAHFVQETGNQQGPTSGLVYLEEIDGPSKDYCDEARTEFPCAGGGYHGRGPMQLSWNYNYGTAGQALGLNFLAQPNLVIANGENAFNAALWFWMTRQPIESPHTQIVTGKGFGETIRTVNGPLECDGGHPAAVTNRVNAYNYFCQQLGIDPGGNQGC